MTRPHSLAPKSFVAASIASWKPPLSDPRSDLPPTQAANKRHEPARRTVLSGWWLLPAALLGAAFWIALGLGLVQGFKVLFGL